MEELSMLILLNIFILCHGLRDNVALYKDSRQSSTHYESGSPGSPFLATDGNKQQVAYQPPFDQLFCTSTITNDLTCWWAVDLGQEYSINSVTIFNRLDCCSKYVRQMIVSSELYSI
ncbi:fucolectin-1-like [Mytilus trossulus]|uniref:fucolectin-1-like n=1 Tax=Mytilus trossulus TaxID=6551 RepID=UPI0030070F23